MQRLSNFIGLNNALLAIFLIKIAVLTLPLQLSAQNKFKPAIIVDDYAITRYEIEQRALFFEILGVGGNSNEEAKETLVEDRLKTSAFESIGVEVTLDQIKAGQEEFANRVNLTNDEFIALLEDNGIEQRTFQDFVESGIGWREFIRQRFLTRARPTEPEVDRAMAVDGGAGGVRVLLSEIYLPFTSRNFDAVRRQAEQITKLTSISEFSQAARRFSKASTAPFGGRLDWMLLSQQPAELRPNILSLSIGEVTDPIISQNAIRLLQLRDIQESNITREVYSAIEYASLEIPANPNNAENILARIDTCDDLYGIAADQPYNILKRNSFTKKDIPQYIADELATLDEGEAVIARHSSDDNRISLIMLCSRTAARNENTEREEVANALFQQRLDAFSTSYIDQLRANALIIEYE